MADPTPRDTLDRAIALAADRHADTQAVLADARFEMDVLDAALRDLQHRRDNLWWKVYHPATERLDATRRWIEHLADVDPTGTLTDDELAAVPVIRNLMAHEGSRRDAGARKAS